MSKQHYNIKPSDAINYNDNSDKSAFVIPYGGTPGDPEYLYPGELQPASVKAFKNNEDYNRYIGNQAGKQVSAGISRFGHQFMPVLVGAAAAPWLISGGIAAYSNPIIRTGLDIIGTVDGVKNFFSGNGVQKTIRLARKGDVKGAIKSGIGDTFDLIGIGDTFSSLKPLYKIAKYNPKLFKDSEMIKQLMDVAKDKPSNIIHSDWVDFDFEVPEVFAWATRTPRFKQAYPNGFEIFARGFHGDGLKRAVTNLDGKLGSRYADPRTGVTAVFGGDLPTAGAYTGQLVDSPSNINNYKKFGKNQTDGNVGLFVVPKTKTVGVNGNGKSFGDIVYPNAGDANLYNTGADAIAHHLAKYDGENFVYHNTFDGYPRQDGTWGNGVIYMSADGKYPKSVYDSDLKFDLNDGSPFKKHGGILKSSSTELPTYLKYFNYKS